MNTKSDKKMILLVCGGNTCRSPMAKVILKQKLVALGQLSGFEIDSAACNSPTSSEASSNARAAIEELFGQDLLASHKAKKLTPELAEKADLILVMGARMKKGLPSGKTWTLKEYAGGSGDIADLFGCSLQTYLACAHEISTALDEVVTKLLQLDL